MAKNSMKVLGALTIAAALTMTMMTACSSDDNFVDNRNAEQQTANAVTVTVGAGISDGALTRSDVVDVDGKRALTFTTGDRLYVYGEIDASTSVAGYLDMVGSPTNSNKSATFSGTLKAYDISSATPVETTMPSGDPFALCTYKTANATLIHKDLNTDAIRVTLGKKVGLYDAYMNAANVETLMKTALPVQGDYASGTNSFTLSCSCPIFKCSFSGLTASTNYEVGLYYYQSNTWIQSFRNTFTSTAGGVIDVAFASYNSGTKFWKINVNASEFVRNIHIGTKDLTAKVYSVTRDLTNKTFADATAGDVGKVIGANGSIYANATAASDAGSSAVAVIAYVGDNGDADASSEIYKGLALAMSDADNGSGATWCSQHAATCLTSQCGNEGDALADMAGIAHTDYLINNVPDGHNHTDKAASLARSNHGTAHPTGTSDWFLPSAGQWEKMRNVAGGATLRTIAGLPETGTDLDYYWSSTEYNAIKAWVYRPYQSGSWNFFDKDTSYPHRVRAAIAF